MQTFQQVIPSAFSGKPLLTDWRYDERYEGTRSALVFLHGFKGFKDWGGFNAVADWLAAKGFLVLKFNFSHNGTTPETPTDFTDLDAFGQNNFSIELQDVQTVLDWMLSEAFPDRSLILSNRVFLFGHSRGGGVALITAAEDTRIDKVVAWAGIGSIGRNYDPEMLEQWKADGVVYIPNARTGQQMPLYYQLAEDCMKNWERFDLAKKARYLAVPMLALHGRNDQTVSWRASARFALLNPLVTCHLLPGADHTFGMRHPTPSAEHLPPDTLAALEVTYNFLLKRRCTD